MKYLKFLLIISLALAGYRIAGGQNPLLIDSVFVETYYIADSADAAFENDEDSVAIAEGAITYRIYVDLAKGARLTSIYGDAKHSLIFSSSAPFYNHAYPDPDYGRGKVFGYQIKRTDLRRNTVGLDTWITLGLPTSTVNILSAPKAFDTDTFNFLMEKRKDSLLRNSHPLAGIPLTLVDGMVYADSLANYPLASGFADSTIFGFAPEDTLYTSNSDYLFYNKVSSIPGMQGPDTLTSRLLIAQLTTAGAIRFDLNLEIASYNTRLKKWETFKYVARNPNPTAGEDSSFWLSYPRPAPDCGCNDPRYAEFDLTAPCFHPDSCINLIRLGCTDPAACNFDPDANYPRDGSYCCYNSECAYNLDLVCPGTVYGCTDPAAVNYNPLATTSSTLDVCYYPADAGCTNSAYREFNPDKRYHVEDSCRVLKISGCMDRAYCNYNPFANIHKLEMCSNQYCDSAANASQPRIMVYPNPTRSEVYIGVSNTEGSVCDIEISNAYGRRIEYIRNSDASESSIVRVSLDNYPKGVYVVKVSSGSNYSFKKFIIE